MFIEKFPVFERDMILKAEMLTGLQEYPKDMFQLRFMDYSDGILSGTRVAVTENNLVISPGIIKYGGKLFHMEEEVKVPYNATGEEQCLKIRFLEEEKHSDFTTCKSEIILEGNLELFPEELELCRFTLKTGAVLRQDYQDLSDFATLHNTVNILHVNYAGRHQPTISPEITSYYGREVLRLNPENPFDISFGMLCLQNAVVEREVIQNYLAARLTLRREQTLTNVQLHEYLLKALDNVRNGRNGLNRGEGRGRRLIVE